MDIVHTPRADLRALDMEDKLVFFDHVVRGLGMDCVLNYNLKYPRFMGLQIEGLGEHFANQPTDSNPTQEEEQGQLEEPTEDAAMEEDATDADATTTDATTTDAAATTTDNGKKMSKRQRQRAKKKTARERAATVRGGAASPPGVVEAPADCDAAPTSTDAAASGQASAPAVDSGLAAPIQPPRATSDSPAAFLGSHGAGTSHSEAPPRDSDVMSCASSVQDGSSSYESDCDDDFTKVTSRSKRRRRDSPAAEALAAPTANHDLMLASDTFDKCQRLLRLAGEVFKCRDLKLNPQKSVALAVRSVPGKKVLFASTIARFYVEGTPLWQLSPTKLAKYLGLGQSKPHIDSLQEQLSRLHFAPLKPAQDIPPSTPDRSSSASCSKEDAAS
ncbi:hypothetical protein ILUMI_27136 [Ignelater luminosus]|uniref:Uncharacterized protein n=1 Tax=Ignelater luminosus TaxID=2038154 RepID=A0A8K0FX25_IGNLU|nr:hypothetical protein ILUMI_27136 [Ignelater luminosus]